jgi:hypothetical protein
VVNPVIAACEEGYVPGELHLMTNPGLEESTARITELLDLVVTGYGVDEPSIELDPIEDETDFEAITDYFRSRIEAAQAAGDDVAVDMTPGRKYMSAIALQVGIRFDADHVFYVHIPSDYFRRFYPTIPRPAVELYDFTEVF